MIAAVCTGRLTILKKYDLSVSKLKDLLQVLFLLQRIADSAAYSAYARTGMHLLHGMLQWRINRTLGNFSE